MRPNEGRRFRPVFVSAVAFFFLVISSAYYYSTTPTFAWREIRKAVEEKDLATFYTRTDMPRLVDAFIDAAATREVTRAAGDDWVNFKERFRGELSKILKAQTLAQIKKDLETYFNGQPLADLPGDTLGKIAPMRDFFRRVGSWTPIGDLSRSERQARVNLAVRIPKLDKSYPLVLLLEKNDIWQLSGIEGLATVMDLFDENSAAFVEAYNQRMERRLSQSLTIRSQEIRKDQNWIVNKSLYLALAIRNNSDRTLESLNGTIELSGGNGETLIHYPFRLAPTEVLPQQEKIYSITAAVKLFDRAANRAFLEDNLRMGFRFESASFAGQRPFRRARTLDDVPSG